jgi:hypothetical protein
MFPIKRLEKIHEELHRYYLQVINRKTRLKELDISINSPSLIQYMKERIKNLPLELIYPNNNPEYALSILELMEINTLNQSLRRINPK